MGIKLFKRKKEKEQPKKKYLIDGYREGNVSYEYLMHRYGRYLTTSAKVFSDHFTGLSEKLDEVSEESKKLNSQNCLTTPLISIEKEVHNRLINSYLQSIPLLSFAVVGAMPYYSSLKDHQLEFPDVDFSVEAAMKCYMKNPEKETDPTTLDFISKEVFDVFVDAMSVAEADDEANVDIAKNDMLVTPDGKPYFSFLIDKVVFVNE